MSGGNPGSEWVVDQEEDPGCLLFGAGVVLLIIAIVIVAVASAPDVEQELAAPENSISGN